MAVVGLGKSGVAAARLLAREGVRVYASDGSDHPYAAGALDALRALPGVEVEVGRHDLAKIRAAAGVVVSPGVPPDAPPVAAARQAKGAIVSELDLGFRALADGTRCIAITGTNGKTTTTALVAHLLTVGGRRATAGGNIGRPLADIALAGDRYDWLSVEVSSFQLHDSPHFTPDIGIVTNLAPARGRRAAFSLRQPADAWYEAPAGVLRLGSDVLARREDLHLLGDHNVANALAAALAVRAAGVPPGTIAAGLRSFQPLPHRLELVRDVEGVRWINDSKATNIASTVVAVEAMDRPFVLLLGGRHKGEPYTRLAPLLENRCRLVIAYGESGPIVEQDLGGRVPLERGTTFADVIARAQRAAKRGDAVLLSPACSSYDMFKNYEERGATFRRLVEAM